MHIASEPRRDTDKRRAGEMRSEGEKSRTSRGAGRRRTRRRAVHHSSSFRKARARQRACSLRDHRQLPPPPRAISSSSIRRDDARPTLPLQSVASLFWVPDTKYGCIDTTFALNARRAYRQRGGGCAGLGEHHASWAACLLCGLCARLTRASRRFCTMRAGELGRHHLSFRSGGLVRPPIDRQTGRDLLIKG